MLRKNLSQQSLCKQNARVSLSRKLPSDFFFPLDSPKIFPLRKLQKLQPMAKQNKFINKQNTEMQKRSIQRKKSFQFTFYRSSNNQQKISRQTCNKQKSSKRDILQKFNIKLPYIRSAQSGIQRRKKLQKVRRTTNFNRDQFEDSLTLPLR